MHTGTFSFPQNTLVILDRRICLICQSRNHCASRCHSCAQLLMVTYNYKC